MEEKKILIGPSTFAEKDKTPLSFLEKAGYSVINNPFGRKLTKKELLELLNPDVVGLIAGLEILDREVLSKSRLKCISRVGAGVSNIDLIAAKELNIMVANTPDGPTQSVAELTIGALLSLLRMISEMNIDLHNGKWSKKIGYQLEGKTCLIIGYGRIGKRVASLLQAFGARIIVFDPYVDIATGYEKLDSLTEALNIADIVSLHNSGEECLLSSREFNVMKKGVVILNASRGASVDEKALIESLNNNIVTAAWIDTFIEEPYNGELTKYKNVILTPHVGSYTLECRRSMELEAVNNLLTILS